MAAIEPTLSSARKPSVIVDDVHVTYREYAVPTTGPRARGLFKGAPPTRKSRRIQALKGVSFVAHEGESIAVLGRNGSGKSTLMSVIAGLLSPTAGHVFADSNPTHLGVNAAFMGDLTGNQNIALGGLAMGLDKRTIQDRYEEIVDFSGIGEFVDLPMRTYSSGMAARLKFSIATTVTHQILIIDEALSVGDEGFGRQSRKRIAELRDAAGTVFLVSHSLQQLRESCDRGIWLDAGRIVMDGPIDLVADAYHIAQSGRADIGAAKIRATKTNTPEAEKKYKAAIAVRNNPAACLNLLEKAIDLHLEAPAWWHFTAAECAVELGDLAGAIAWFEEGIAQKLRTNDDHQLADRFRQYAAVCERAGATDRGGAARHAASRLDNAGADALYEPRVARFREPEGARVIVGDPAETKAVEPSGRATKPPQAIAKPKRDIVSTTVRLAPYSDDQGNKIEYDGPPRDDIEVLFRGSNNRLVIDASAKIARGASKFSFHQSNGLIQIGGGKQYLTRPSFTVGEDSSIILGHNVSSTAFLYIRASEGGKVVIGDDVMIASRVELRADDSHPIFDVDSGQRVNPSGDITIGSHVWLSIGVVVMGGVSIGDGTVVGLNSVVTRSLPNNVVAVGTPARVVRRNIAWERPNLSLSGTYRPDASSVVKSDYWRHTEEG